MSNDLPFIDPTRGGGKAKVELQVKDICGRTRVLSRVVVLR